MSYEDKVIIKVIIIIAITFEIMLCARCVLKALWESHIKLSVAKH